jgi:hypothetical protein
MENDLNVSEDIEDPYCLLWKDICYNVQTEKADEDGNPRPHTLNILKGVSVS